MNALERKFQVYSLPDFILTGRNFSCENATFIQSFTGFKICITKRLKVPDVSCSKETIISWSDMVEKTDSYFRSKFMDLNEDKNSLYTLNNILNNESWEKLFSIIGLSLMDFILTKSILLRISPTDDIYFVINRDCYTYCQELSTPDFEKVSQSRVASSVPNFSAENSQSPQNSFSKKLTFQKSRKIMPALIENDTGFLSFTPALYSKSNNLFWLKKSPLLSKTASEILKMIIKMESCKTFEFARLQEAESKFSNLRSLISDIIILHKSRLHEKIIRKFHVLSKKKSLSEIRLEKRRRKAAKNKLKAFPSLETGENFLKKKLRAVKPVSKMKILSILSKLIRKFYYALLCGSEANFSLLKKRLANFLKFGKGQSISVKYFTDGIRLKNIKWLQSFTSLRVKKFLFARVFAWFFKESILKFLAIYFYITETGKSKNSLVFFDKISWISMKKIYLTYLSRSQKFRNISRKDFNEFLKTAAFKSNGQFRFIPKHKGVRPLTIMRYASEEKKKLEHYKIVLQQLLHNISHSPPRNEILECLNTYYKKLKSNEAELFFVKVDIFDAFGSILQDKLINIIKKGLESINMSRKLSLHEVHTVFFSHTQKKFLKKKRYSINLSRVKAPKNSINIFSSNKTLVDVPSMMCFLENFIKHQIFKEGPHYFHQIIGVPQSNPLSAVFSDLYYNDLTGQHLKPLAHENNLFYRFSDDFIFITPNQQDAVEFYNVARTGFPDYNCCINKKKIETNLPQSPSPVSNLHFFGFIIDVCSSTITVDYSLFNKTNVLSSIMLLEDESISKVVEYHFRDLQICANSLYKLSLKYRFNSLKSTALNFFEGAFMVAVKFRILVDTLFHNKRNTRYLVQIILKIVLKFEELNEAMKTFKKFALSQNLVKFITIDGFNQHLHNYPSWYEVSLELDCVCQEIYGTLPWRERQMFS